MVQVETPTIAASVMTSFQNNVNGSGGRCP
jgi:hypothetical protein